MKHFGDITQLHGWELPIVDIITGGSPCQDLSVAGKRAGLAGERSGLFMEQIRIIKEMREHDRVSNRRADGYIRPRYMVWENVPGAFSSNKGEDFKAVLEETAKVADENAVIPRLEEGRWTPSGCVVGDGWSIAWRVHDAQFWGVPQRRKRIALVADFGGYSAPEILFERKSLFGDIEESREEGKDTAGTVGEDADKTIYDVRISSEGTKNWRAHCYETDISRNLDTGGVNQTVTTEGLQSSSGISGEISGTLDASYYKGCGERQGVEREVVYCLQGNGIDRADTAGCNGKGWREDQSYTLNTIDRPAVCVGNGQADQLKMSDKVGALNCMHDQQAIMVLNDQSGSQMSVSENVTGTLRSEEHGHQPIVYGTKPLLSTRQAIGEYKIGGGAASTVRASDYKDATDLVIQ